MANLLWLAEVARGAGLVVEECEGWEARCRTYCAMNPKGVVCHHTGDPAGGDMPSLDSNCDVVGIEAENTGSDPWPRPQLDAYVDLVAAICDHLGLRTDMVAGHKEWAPRRKPDPHAIDMGQFRRWVQFARSSAAVSATPPVQQEADIFFEIGRVPRKRSLVQSQ
ncbi:MAG: N-acetylmuramoyl-L-alanine amidase [Actinomycetota bacterium]|nr:N-acetylmuramoyl-L-alanine amidase [Actinomycetota bacterium]